MITKLNKEFVREQILTAEELNAITGKVDEIIDETSSLLSENDISYTLNDQVPSTGTGSYRIGDLKVGNKVLKLYGKDFTGDGDGNAKNGGYYEPAFKTFSTDATLSLVQSEMPANGVADLSNGWAHSAENITGDYAIWMINRYVTGQGAYGDWLGPWRISGANGENGIDGDTMEYIYFRSNTDDPQFPSLRNTQPAAGKEGLTPADDDFVPLNWFDNPKGVDLNNRYEWMAFRTKTGAHQGVGGTWSEFIGPILWSSYGVNGIDGDGIEYIFYAMAEGGVRPENDPAGLPSSWYSREGAYQTEQEYRRGNWEDDPQDLESLGFGARQFVSVRKKYADNEGEQPYWHQYSDYTLWSYYAHDGHSNTVIPAVIYSIQVTGSTVSVTYGENSNTVSGTIQYKIMRSEGSDRSFVTVPNEYNITTKAMLGGSTECNVLHSNGVYTATIDGTYSGTENFTEIIVYDNNTPVASTVIPTIIPGEPGQAGSTQIQPIGSPIMRMRGEWSANPDPAYNDGTHTEDGVKYTDIVVYSGLYFKCNSYGTNKRPVDQDGITPQEWGRFSIADDSYINNLIANNAYIQNLTAKQIVVTDANEKPVAGMLNGTYIPTELTDEGVLNTNTNGIRIFAGNIPQDGNVADAPFTVDNSGTVKAGNGSVLLRADGSGQLANGNVSWDVNGNVIIRGMLQVGSKVMEMVEGVTGSIISVNRAGNGVSVSITVTNSNNYTVQVSGACSIDSTNNVWSATCVLPTITLLAGQNYTYPITIAREDIPNYDSSISESDTSVTINAWHFVDI